MESEITFQLILTTPPPDVVFGLQKGSGSNYETIQKQHSTSHDLVFTFTLTVKGEPSKDKVPRWSGSFVQGPAEGRFVYIDIGTYAGQADTSWSRRLKVPLPPLSWHDLEDLAGHVTLQTKVPGTGKDGGPNCATVKPFAGWHRLPPPIQPVH